MNPEPCREMEESLVDYADGALPPEESRRVAEHIERCDACRRTVEALRESIRIAGAVWQDTLQDIEPVCSDAARRFSKECALAGTLQTRVWSWRYAAIAASILLVIGGTLLWSVRSRRASAPPTLAEMERQISESATAARLLAATEVMKDQARELDVSEAQYRHILEYYPNTDAAAQVRLKLKSIR